MFSLLEATRQTWHSFCQRNLMRVFQQTKHWLCLEHSRKQHVSWHLTNILHTNYNKADARPVLHCVHTNAELVVVTARDTDVYTLLVAHLDNAQSCVLRQTHTTPFCV